MNGNDNHWVLLVKRISGVNQRDLKLFGYKQRWPVSPQAIVYYASIYTMKWRRLLLRSPFLNRFAVWLHNHHKC